MAYNNGLDVAVKQIKRDKKRSKLEKCFMKVVNLADFEMCKRIFPEYVDGIEKYLGNFSTTKQKKNKRAFFLKSH